MCCVKGGSVPQGSGVRGPFLAVALGSVVLGACAHQGPSPYQQGGWYAGGPRPSASVPAPVPVDMEDDGRPAQLPPPASLRQAKDDPRESWSPNYGGQALMQRVPQHAVAPPSTPPARGPAVPPQRRVAWAVDPD